MTNISRDQWGARAPRPGPGQLDPSEVQGLALHWPGFEDGRVPPHRGVDVVCQLLRGWQNYHMDGNGWSDIAYQEAVDLDGNVYELRGLRNQSGANGDAYANEHYGAILLVIGPGEHPTAEMIRATRERVTAFRELFPGSRKVVGHAHIRPEPTSCPGPAVLALLGQGAFDPLQPKTRGEHVDAALRHLKKSTHTGTTGARVARAIRILTRIKPWRS